MNESPFDREGRPAADHDWEERLQERARAFPYAPTPDIATAVRDRLAASPTVQIANRRRLLWVAILLLALLAGILAVPQVRAAIVEWLRIGSVIILPYSPTATATPTGTTAATPPPTATLIPSLLKLAGETTFEKAQARATFAIGLPTYPSDLGPPDRVFLQNLSGQAVVLVWLDPTKPDGVRLSLHILTNEAIAYKMDPRIIKEVTVHNQRAIWTEGPYLLEIKSGNSTTLDVTRIVKGNVLIWTAGRLTYRLEGDGLTLDEAVKIAESIPIPDPSPTPTLRMPTITPSASG